jgi:GNAT superfamily N-acetyltransferase
MDVSVRPLMEGDLDTADRIYRMAFGTLLGLADPMTFGGDASYVRTRWFAHPIAAFAAEVDGKLVGSNFVTNWGSVGLFGPLTVHPDMWGKGVAKRLLEPTVALLEEWGIKHAGLFTSAHSPKHIGLYQKFGYWPRFLTAIMSKEVNRTVTTLKWSKYSEFAEDDRGECLDACRSLTNTVYPGLDLQWEIESVNKQGLADTILIWNDDDSLDGLAVCHYGSASEAGSGVCHIKFGAARAGPNSGQTFDHLLDACEAFAKSKGISRLSAGVNVGRREAYRKMLTRGFRTYLQGVAMHKPDEPGYNQPDVYVIDDWR